MKQKLHQHIRDQRLDRWLARGAVIVIVGLQTMIVNDLSFGPWWLGPSVEIALLIPLSIGTVWTQRSAARAETEDEWDHVGAKRKWVRRLAIVMTATSTLLNFAALFLLTRAIFLGHAGTGRTLLLDAINIWATNVVVFALWFWTLDRGSPSSRGLVLPDRETSFLPSNNRLPIPILPLRAGRPDSWTTCFSPTRTRRRFHLRILSR